MDGAARMANCTRYPERKSPRAQREEYGRPQNCKFDDEVHLSEAKAAEASGTGNGDRETKIDGGNEVVGCMGKWKGKLEGEGGAVWSQFPNSKGRHRGCELYNRDNGRTKARPRRATHCGMWTNAAFSTGGEGASAGMVPYDCIKQRIACTQPRSVDIGTLNGVMKGRFWQ